MWDVLLDALIDSLKIFPFLFLIYLIMEIIENFDKENSIERLLRGKYAPLFGSAVGLVPQCGFSVMCSKLYDTGLIRTGTILAVFLSTSDEGLVVLISGGASFLNIVLLLGIKFVYAVIAGTFVNILFSKREILSDGKHDSECIECEKANSSDLDKYFLHPLIHALKIFIYVLIINVAFGLLVYFIGEDKIVDFISQKRIVQVVVAPLIGLIPNCSASVILSQSYLKDMLCFSGLIAGLTANAGIGFAIIFKNKKRIKHNLFLLFSAYILSVILGLVVLLFESI